MPPKQFHQKAATAVLVLGGLFVSACGARAANTAPAASAPEAKTQANSCASCGASMGDHHGQGPGMMMEPGGPQHMMAQAGDCPMMHARTTEPSGGTDKK